MRSLARMVFLSALFVAAGCAGNDGSANRADRATHATASANCCGSPDSDLYGCTSPDCCARTGRDCGHETCVCRTLEVHPEEGAQ